MQITLPTSTTYYDVHLATGFTAGQSIIIRNETSTTLHVIISPTLPTSDTGSIAIVAGAEYVFSPKTSKLWVRGSTGPIHCETLIDSRSSPFERVDLSPDLYTSDREGFRRLRVDTGQTGFFEGREFRTFFDVSIPTATSVYIRFTSPIDFIIFEQSLTLDAGSIKFTALTGATPGGSYSNVLPVIGKNRMASRKSPFYTAQCTLASGGTATGGTIVELFRVTAANSNAQAQTVLGAASTERGLPAGTYYLRLENIGNSAATGVYSLIWEERP
uniref:Virion structural protein n=2 Tax=unclassified bacterial viruses TaxID=12333 RepID=A0AAU6VYE6_9VIRU